MPNRRSLRLARESLKECSLERGPCRFEDRDALAGDDRLHTGLCHKGPEDGYLVQPGVHPEVAIWCHTPQGRNCGFWTTEVPLLSELEAMRRYEEQAAMARGANDGYVRLTGRRL